jgi:putative ABC transport system permease protein
MDSWLIDLRYSMRRLLSRPTYTLLAVLTLAFGAGGVAAIFSITRALLLDRLPVANEEQIGVLWFPFSWTEQEFLHFRPTFPGFQRMAAYMPGDQTLEANGEPLRLVRGLRASAELFDVLGTHAFIGRTFQAGDDRPGAAPVAVLSYGLWQELGGDRSIIGRQLRLGGVARTVVGVMPRGFWFPSPTVRVWVAPPLSQERRNGSWTLVGRVAQGNRVDAMSGSLKAIATELGRNFTYPAQWDKTRAPAMTPLREFIVGDVRAPLLATVAAMALILLIACVNVAALMLGQVSGRSTELAVRTALGARRHRLVRQLVLESLVIGLIAGVVGTVLAAAAFRILLQSLPLGALAETAVLDWSLFAAAVAAGVIAACLVALVPTIALWRGNLRGTMDVARTTTISGRGGRFEGALVIAQIAVAVLLAAGAGLLLRTVGALRHIDPGIRVDTVAVVDATMPALLSQEQRLRGVVDILPKLEALPGVRAAAAVQRLPLLGGGDNWGIAVKGRTDLADSTTAFRIVTPHYFAAMGIPVRRGRVFEDTDRQSRARVVVINEALAAKYFPGVDPIGREVQTFDEQGERIIGVVGNVAEVRLTDPVEPVRYMLYEHVPALPPSASFVLAATNAAAVPAVIDAARSVFAREGRQLAIERTLSMASIFDDALGAPGRLVTLLSLLAALALLLGAIGVYGMISHFVIRRLREYGIRVALGLSPSGVLSQVFGRGLALVVGGSMVGAIGALALTPLLGALLYGVRANDPAALGGAVAALLVAGAIAAAVPAVRASRMNPAATLRDQ